MELTDKLIHDAFSKTEIDQKYYSLYETEVKRHYKNLQDEECFDEESTEDDNVLTSIDITNKYITYYVAEIEKGHSHKWAHEYAQWVNCRSESYAVISAFDSLPKEDREKELIIYANSIDKDPIFVKRFIFLFNMGEPNAKEKAQDYCYAYHSCISNGKSEIYAHAYADAVNDDRYTKFCEIYADAYECAINHRMEDCDAYAFGEFCVHSADRDYWLMLHDFKCKYKEEWQREFYLQLMKQDYEEEKKRPITEKEFDNLRDAVFGK